MPRKTPEEASCQCLSKIVEASKAAAVLATATAATIKAKSNMLNKGDRIKFLLYIQYK
jgi:hypothetical protein